MKVKHDLFPATIVAIAPGIVEDYTTVTTNLADVPNGNKFLERVRVVIMTNDDGTNIIMVAGDHHSGPRLIFSERLASLNWSGDKTQDSQALTESGKIIAFRKTQGCSTCGSRLRSWSPYKTMDSVKDPTE
jgi:hypothetical protein